MLVARGAAVSASTLFLLPEIVSLAVGYQLLKRVAHPVREAALREVSASIWPTQEPTAGRSQATDWGRLLAGVRAEVAQIVAVLARAEPKDVPAWVGDALTGLETLADRVEEAQPTNASARTPQLMLVAGIRSLQGGLVDLSETAWRGDHRFELARLRGLDEIERALAQLEDSAGER